MKSLFIITFLLLLLNGCNNIKPTEVVIKSNKSDSIVNCYIRTFDSFRINPAKNDPALPFLRAIKNQDTSFLIAAYDSLKIELYMDSINNIRFKRIGIEKIEDLKFE